MSLTQGGQQLPSPSVIPAFQGDVSQMTDLANSLGGESVGSDFAPSAGMTSAAGVGNNYFGAGGTGTTGMNQLSNILSGANLNPASNPYLQQNIGAMQQAFGQTLGQGEDSLNAQFAGSGQYGGDSGARDNAMTRFGTQSMQNFGNTLADFLGGNYEQGQGQITSALGDLGAPLSAAGTASGLGQAPGQTAYSGTLAQNNLTEVPFNLLQEVMQSAPAVANAA